MKISRLAIVGSVLTMAFGGMFSLRLFGQDCPAAKPKEHRSPTLVVRKVDQDDVKDIKPQTKLGPGEAASCAMKPMQIRVEEDVVHLLVEADFMNRKPESKYVWGLRIFSKHNDEKVVDRIYDHQTFSLVSESMKTIDFTEDMPMQPGVYQARILLFQVKSEKDLASIKNGEVNRSLILCESRKDFTVGLKSTRNKR